MCGFPLDSRAGETAQEFAPNATADFAVAQAERRFSRWPVLLVRLNPDLAMGDALLKKATGAGNLFTGAKPPYKKRQRTLRADIDEDAWANPYRTRSRPFPVSPTRKVAVRMVDHYGDEVLKVYGA